MTTFTRLDDGTWGLRGEHLVPGTWVMVSKRNAPDRKMYVGEIVKAFPCAVIAKIGKAPKATKKAKKTAPAREPVITFQDAPEVAPESFQEPTDGQYDEIGERLLNTSELPY